MSDSPANNQAILDLKLGHGIGCIHQHRGSNRSGVAIFFNKSRMQLKKFPVKCNGCEIVVGRSKITDNCRPIFIISCYLPPGMRRAKVSKCLDAIRDTVTKIKITERDPIIIMAGDINKYDLTPALDDFLDIKCASSPPSRGSERLDLLFTNVDNFIAGSSLHSPLEALGGAPSDHRVLLFKMDFSWITYRARDLTQKNYDKFHELYTAINWEDLLGKTECPTKMTEILHSKIKELTDTCLFFGSPGRLFLQNYRRI